MMNHDEDNETIEPSRGQPGWILREYLRHDGSFDYDEYRRIQIQGNHAKIDHVWAQHASIVFLANALEQRLDRKPERIICHGTRRGVEQQWFLDCFGCEVVGTEISDTATQFPNTVQWDFHEEQDDWIESADIVYSNSWDHSYDPKRMLDVWMRQLRPHGICVLEHSRSHVPERTSNLDPFGATLEGLVYLILRWGCGRYFATELIDVPTNIGGNGERPLTMVLVRRGNVLAGEF